MWNSSEGVAKAGSGNLKRLEQVTPIGVILRDFRGCGRTQNCHPGRSSCFAQRSCCAVEGPLPALRFRRISYRNNTSHLEPAVKTLGGPSTPLRVCDFFDVVKNRGCKQNSYDDKLVINSKKSQTLRMTVCARVALSVVRRRPQHLEKRRQSCPSRRSSEPE